MKFGMNLLLWTAHVTSDQFPLLGQLKQAGYDGVEIPLFEGDAPHYTKIKAELDRQGLACSTVTVLTETTNPVSPEPSIRTAAKDRLKWAIEMTHSLGGDILCGPIHSALGYFSGTGPTDDEKQRAAEVLREAAELAAQANVTLAVEYLNRFECYFLTTAADTRALVERVNHPNFRSMYDTFHANIEEKDVAGAIRHLADVLVHVHISENDRGTPGTGHVHWDVSFQTLKQVGYSGWLTIEAFGRALPDLAAATKVWRDLFPTPQEVYTYGLQFMRQAWQAA